MRQISVLLTTYSDLFSTMVYYVGGQSYTHSSIALEDDPDQYYSFNYRGFAIETTEKHRRKGVKKSICFHIQVPDEAYRKIEERIHRFQSRREEYRYTRLGVVCCALHLPFRWKRHYFCSQFVAELLKGSGAVPLRKRPNYYLPNRFVPELSKLPACQQIVYNPV